MTPEEARVYEAAIHMSGWVSVVLIITVACLLNAWWSRRDKPTDPPTHTNA